MPWLSQLSLGQNWENAPPDIVAENAKLKQELKKTKDKLIDAEETIKKQQQRIQELELQNQDKQQV